MQSSIHRYLRSPVVPVVLSMVSLHAGAAIAKSLFEQITPLGLVSLRLSLAAGMLLIFTRPHWRHYTWSGYRLLGLLGLSIAVMNTLLYHAIAYIPLGVAVTLEFVGPLGIALVHSRRGLDLLWVALAAAGVMLLAPIGGITLHPFGVMLSLMSGGCWAAYIVLSARVGKVFSGSEGVAMAMAAGAIAILPFGIAAEGRNLLSPWVLLLGLMVAMLSSALPYSLEMAALRQLPVKVFGVLMSLEPAVASCVGLLILGEQLSLRVMVAIILVSGASAGSAWGADAHK